MYLYSRKNYFTIDAIQNKIQSYIYLQILNQTFLDCYLSVTIPCQFAAIGFCWILGVSASIRLPGIVTLFDYLGHLDQAFACGFILFGLMHFSGNIARECTKFIIKMNQTTKCLPLKYWRIKIRSLSIFGIQNGPIRIMKHKAIFHYFMALQNYIVTILVIHRNLI